MGTTSVNGVSFAAFAFPVFSDFQRAATNANVSFVENPGTLVSFSNLGSIATPYSGLSGAYQSLLNGGASTTNPATVTVTLDGLTPGNQYLLQWWSSNAANQTGQFAESLQQTTAAATNQVTLDSNVTDTDGGVGQLRLAPSPPMPANSSLRSIRLRLTERTGAIPWQVYPGDRHWFHSWGQVSFCGDAPLLRAEVVDKTAPLLFFRVFRGGSSGFHGRVGRAADSSQPLADSSLDVPDSSLCVPDSSLCGLLDLHCATGSLKPRQRW